MYDVEFDRIKRGLNDIYLKKNRKYKRNRKMLIANKNKIKIVKNINRNIIDRQKKLKDIKKAVIYNNNGNNNVFDDMIINFIDYVNNFRSLYNEDINRLKYYHYNLSVNLYNKSNVENFSLNRKYLDLSSKLFETRVNDRMLKSGFIALIIVFYSYKEVISFIPKKNIFCKRIDKKIDDLIKFFLSNIKFENNFNVENILDKIKNILELDYFRTLSSRQKYRNNYNNILNELFFKSSTNF